MALIITLASQGRHLVFSGKVYQLPRRFLQLPFLDLGTFIVGLPVFELFKVKLIIIELLVFEPPTLSSQLFLRNRTDTILRFNALS